MITAQLSSTTLIFIMSSSLVQLFLLALISIVTANRTTPLTTGNNVARPGEFPFLASIRIRGAHLCAGSIISPKFIITAGHCVRYARNAINDVTVVTGSVQLSRGGYTSRIASVHNAAEDGRNPDTDIGLIKNGHFIESTMSENPQYFNPDPYLVSIYHIFPEETLASYLNYDDYTRSVPYDSNPPEMDSFGTVIGWGSASHKETAPVDFLQYMYAYITDLSCNGFYNTAHAICTNNGPTVGVCYGDSGSPLIYRGKIVGVVSRAVLCAKGFSDVYSSIKHNINFIRLIVNTA